MSYHLKRQTAQIKTDQKTVTGEENLAPGRSAHPCPGTPPDLLRSYRFPHHTVPGALDVKRRAGPSAKPTKLTQ